jgi:hypothetical protein
VAIPARHIARIAPQHLLAAGDEIFQHLVQRVADMQMAIRIRGAIMQDEGLAPCGTGAQPVIDAKPFPAGQPFGFARRQARAHGEFGLGQEEGIFVIGCLGHGLCHFRGILGLLAPKRPRHSGRIRVPGR